MRKNIGENSRTLLYINNYSKFIGTFNTTPLTHKYTIYGYTSYHCPKRETINSFRRVNIYQIIYLRLHKQVVAHEVFLAIAHSEKLRTSTIIIYDSNSSKQMGIRECKKYRIIIIIFETTYMKKIRHFTYLKIKYIINV